jgi:hypothetical protein
MTPRRTYQLPGTARKALWDIRLFLKAVNKRSDDVAEKQNSMRCLEAQQHYNQAIELIERINDILK